MKRSIIIFFTNMLIAALLVGCMGRNQNSGVSAAIPGAESGVESIAAPSVEARTAPSAELSAELQAYLGRVLTDQQLDSLKDADLETLRESISTIGDAIAYLDQYTPRVYSGFAEEIRLDLDFVFNLHVKPEATTPQTYTAFVAWCMTDDFDGIQYVISTCMTSGIPRTLPMLAFPVEGGFWIYSPHEASLLMKSSEGYSVNVQVDTLENLEEKIVLPWSNTNHLQIFVADAAQQTLTFRVDDKSIWAEPNQGNAEMVYAIPGSHERVLSSTNDPSASDGIREYPRHRFGADLYRRLDVDMCI